MMAEYIKRADAMKICRGYSQHCFKINDAKGQDIADRIEDDILEIPTADVVEVKHGNWRQNQHCRRIYYCSVCGRHIEDASQRPKEFFPYCHCGAKMDGGS